MISQSQFDEMFITSTEVCQLLDVQRATIINGIKSGRLPPPIIIRRANSETPHIVLWNRSQVLPLLSDWKIAIDTRKAELA